MGKVDLHVHTTASDGKFSPAEIVQKARESGILYLGICDHDSIEGLKPAQAAAGDGSDIRVIGGVEINTDIPTGELHILGYLCNFENAELKRTLEQLRESRLDRTRKMIEKLNNLGCNISYERVKAIAGSGSVGRPHIAEALLEKGYVSSFKEAFNKYINRGGPAYVEKDKLTPAEATRLIVRSGGIPVLAHPLIFDNPEPLIRELKAVGLAGLEVYYGSYSSEQINELLSLANNHNLIATGGSDFHGIESNNEPPLGTVEVPLACAERLLQFSNR